MTVKSNRNKIPALEGGVPIRKNFLTFGKPKVGNAEIREVVDSLRSGWLGTGPKVGKFEEMVRGYVGAKYAIALNSCTAGLHLSLLACGIKKGDEVITTPMTFAATANVIEHVGAKPVFADIDLASMNIDPLQIEKKLTKRTKAIIPVHMAGRPCEMDSIIKIAKKYKLIVIEDAAHAFGAENHGKKIGTIGDLTVFSFYVTKNLITGEGGMVTTNNKKYDNFIRVNCLHGLDKGAWKRYSQAKFKNYQVISPGYKYNMMDLQAAMGIHQLKRFPAMQERRAEIWNRYNNAFADLPVELPAPTEKDRVHALHLYTLLLKTEKLNISRDFFLQALHKENIGAGVHFLSLHVHEYYKKRFGFHTSDFPNALFYSDRTLSLPLSAKLTNSDVEDVIAAVRKVLTYFYK